MISNEHFIEKNHISSCPACESQRISETYVTESFQYGAGGDAIFLTARVPLSQCSECGLEYTDERTEHIKHSAVCKHLNILEPEQIVAIRERYKISQHEFAAISRISRASLARWESRAVHQNASSDSLLYLLGYPDIFKLLANRFKESEEPIELTQKKNVPRFSTMSDEEVVFYRNVSKSFDLHPGH